LGRGDLVGLQAIIDDLDEN